MYVTAWLEFICIFIEECNQFVVGHGWFLQARNILVHPQIWSTSTMVKKPNIHSSVWRIQHVEKEAVVSDGKLFIRSSNQLEYNTFLRLFENITELYRFLLHKICKSSCGKIICAFDSCSVSDKAEQDTSLLCPTNHKEGDTRVFLHVKDMANKDIRRVMIRTVDTVCQFSPFLYSMILVWPNFGSTLGLANIVFFAYTWNVRTGLRFLLFYWL